MARYIFSLLVLFLTVYFGSRLVPGSRAKPISAALRHGKHPKRIAQVATLPDHFKLSETSKHAGRRLIFIGDVHGAYDELVALLEKVEYNTTKDHVVFLGDLVSKGPHSAKVVKLAMKINASCVIGNHDYDLLEWMGYVSALDDSKVEFHSGKQGSRELVLGSEKWEYVMGFERQAAEWLVQCPFILKVGKVNGEELVAVHGGLLPGVPLEEQQPWSIMNMRNIHNGRPSKDTKDGDAWAEIWNKSQRGKKHPITVIYGHDARRGLQIRKHTKGLDTGCVKGGQLTALIYPGEELLSVKCKNYVQK